MNTNERKNQCDEGLSPIIDKLENDVAGWFKETPNATWFLLGAALLAVISPMVVILKYDVQKGKEFSEVIKNMVESGALVAAMFAVIKWVNERRDRATTVLLEMEKCFQKDKVKLGKKLLEERDFATEVNSISFKKDVEELDGLLRFYVVLYGVSQAKQVPQKSLSICFRYWLAHYFRKDRKEFRKYVNNYYPTLSQWLKDDYEAGCIFFRPADFWKDSEIEADSIQLNVKN